MLIFKDRLLRLADFLDKLSPEKFAFSSWVGKTWQGLPDLSCGTTACGLGWASAMPEFQALGLHLTSYSPCGGRDIPTHPRLRDDKEHVFFEGTCFATRVIFGLDQDETELLFVPTDDDNDIESAVDEEDLMDPDDEGEDGRLSRRSTPKRLAKHIRTFVEYKYGAA